MRDTYSTRVHVALQHDVRVWIIHVEGEREAFAILEAGKLAEYGFGFDIYIDPDVLDRLVEQLRQAQQEIAAIVRGEADDVTV